MHQIIQALHCDDLAEFGAHCGRHRKESGRGEQHFMPFAPDDTDGPKGLNVESLELSLDQPGWQRWFVALNDFDSKIVGHVDLKGDGLRAGLHRCELGIGIERPFRGRGLGERLMEAAIGFARSAESLAWIDLRVFAHNTTGRALYKNLGFTQVGILTDRFRIQGTQIDDVFMTLNVA